MNVRELNEHRARAFAFEHSLKRTACLGERTCSGGRRMVLAEVYPNPQSDGLGGMHVTLRIDGGGTLQVGDLTTDELNALVTVLAAFWSWRRGGDWPSSVSHEIAEPSSQSGD